jgi:predicted RNA binding protein YcfA (HicA-like mRNA interferase family)
MRYRELAKRLRKLGCQEVRAGKGSHVIWRNPATGMITCHGRIIHPFYAEANSECGFVSSEAAAA